MSGDGPKRGRPRTEVDVDRLLSAVENVEDLLGCVRADIAESLDEVPHDLVSDALLALGLPMNATQLLRDALTKIPMSHDVGVWVKEVGPREASIELIGKLDGFPCASTIRRRLSDAGLTKPAFDAAAKAQDRDWLRLGLGEAASDGDTVVWASKKEMEGVELPANVRLATAQDLAQYAAERRELVAQAKASTAQWIASRSQRRRQLVTELLRRLDELPATERHVLWITEHELGAVQLPPHIRLATVDDMNADGKASSTIATFNQLTPAWWYSERRR